jgi:hypothetical protein
VEVAAVGDGLVRVRDSKDPGGPQIVISADCWRRSLRCLTVVPDAAGNCLVAAAEGGWVLLRHREQPWGPVLRFTPREWEVFLRGAADGDFALTADGRLRPAAPRTRHLRELAGRRAQLHGVRHSRSPSPSPMAGIRTPAAVGGPWRADMAGDEQPMALAGRLRAQAPCDHA